MVGSSNDRIFFFHTSMFGCQALGGCLPEVARVMRGNAWHKVGISRLAEPLRVSRQR